MSFADIFKNIGNFAKSDSGQGLMNIAGLGLTGLGLYNQNKQNNKYNDLIADQNKLTLQNYNYNKSLNNREIAKENLGQENFTEGFASVFGDKKKKKKQLSDYYGIDNYKG